jgi:uncharacterized membrane protein YphA (DoxX/SURF4 family)
MQWYNKVLGYYDTGMHKLMPWFAKHVFRIHEPITIFSNGSGDTTYDYVTILTFLLLSLIATSVWTIADRKRQDYKELNYWLRAGVRYFLGLVMISYGFEKVFHLQMPSPFLSQQVQPFGDKSPMGLAWSFVGFSRLYSFFVGFGELLGGILLFFRKTTTLGSLLLVVVLANVVAINFCYDVPVKLFSSVLLFMSIFLFAPDAGRLWDLLYRNLPTRSLQMFLPVLRPWQNAARIGLKLLVIVLGTYSAWYMVRRGEKEFWDLRELPHFYGIFNTVSWVQNHETLPPLATDTVRWKRLIIEFPGYAMVYMMNDSTKGYSFNLESSFSHATLFPFGDSTKSMFFRFTPILPGYSCPVPIPGTHSRFLSAGRIPSLSG